MKIPVLDIQGKEVAKIALPDQFSEPVRDDLVKRAVLIYHARARQPYGAKPGAGMRQNAKLSRKRRDYKGAYGHGISRAPRKSLNRRGNRFYWVGAVAPGTVGGRQAHPPKAEKIWDRKLNIQERRKAIRSALSATTIKEIVTQRGHVVPVLYPFALSSAVEGLSTTKEVVGVLIHAGLAGELTRSSVKKVRAGHGKMRGRRYTKKKGPLFVVSDRCQFVKAARNLAGVDVVPVRDLHVKLLAPGTNPGRLTIFTQAALEKLSQEKLFM